MTDDDASATDDETTTTATATDDGSAGDSEADLPEGVRQVLAKERASARSATKAMRALESRVREYEDAQKTEAQKTADRLAEAERRAAEAEQRLMRFDVAAEKGLDAKFADLLSGASREDMEANADRLLELAKAAAPAATARGADFDGGAREDAPTVDINDFIRAGRRRAG